MRSDSAGGRRAAFAVAMLLALGLLVTPSDANAAGRVALVVGNSTYKHIGRLRNPGNDAADLSAALRRLGFDVTTVLDADLQRLNEALRAFGRRSPQADVALVFYAGHGIEVDGANYLLPVDARLEWDRDVEYETVPLDRVLRSTAGGGLRVVILDACRNNPLAQSMQRTDLTRSISRGSFADLDERQFGNETLVAYAAEAGKTVPDGRGRNSPYTSALLRYLEEPLELLTMFRRVRTQVLEATNREQRPWEYQSLESDHYLAGEIDINVTELDVAQLRPMAEQGDARAQNELGDRYYSGRGVARDDAEAVRWYRLAAEQGHATGQANLGSMYYSGRGVARDDAEAVRWYRLAAEQGHATGQANLGSMYYSGRGVARDDAEAVRWCRLAAEQGHAAGQANLGFMYENGRGVERDQVEAVRLYRLAAEQGNDCPGGPRPSGPAAMKTVDSLPHPLLIVWSAWHPAPYRPRSR